MSGVPLSNISISMKYILPNTRMKNKPCLVECSSWS